MNSEGVIAFAEVFAILLTIITVLLGFERRLGKFVTREELAKAMDEMTGRFQITVLDLKETVKENRTEAEKRNEQLLDAINGRKGSFRPPRN